MAQDIVDKVIRRIDPTSDIHEDIELQIRDIIEETESQLCVKLGGLPAVPDTLSYIVVAVSVKRYNRIGSEGTSSHSVEGETMSWNDDPFAEFTEDISAWKANNGADRMRIQFL